MNKPGEQRAILHGLFNLREGVSEQRFKAAFDAFVAHLSDAGFACGGRLTRRMPMDLFGEKLPGFTYWSAIEFPDLGREDACYNYVATNAEPVRSVHIAMNSLVLPGSGQFFVTADI